MSDLLQVKAEAQDYRSAQRAQPPSRHYDAPSEGA
jgi:hypothetical protein